MALYEILNSGTQSVSALLTTVTEDYDRISMHGVRTELLERQAEAIGIPLVKVLIPKGCANDDYENNMREALTRFRDGGTCTVGFGDIFLEDLRRYREDNLAKVQMNAVFPIWKKDSRELAETFINLGFKAIITCVDTKYLDASFAGREYDMEFLEDLHSSVDPCGENGEFHSFVYDGPIFKRPVTVTRGEVVLRDERYSFCDLLPADD